MPPRVANPVMDGMELELVNEALAAVSMTAEEKQALLLVPQVLLARDMTALDKASVIFLMEVAKPDSKADMLPSGPYVFGDYGTQWRSKRVSKCAMHAVAGLEVAAICRLLLVWFAASVGQGGKILVVLLPHTCYCAFCRSAAVLRVRTVQGGAAQRNRGRRTDHNTCKSASCYLSPEHSCPAPVSLSDNSTICACHSWLVHADSAASMLAGDLMAIIA